MAGEAGATGSGRELFEVAQMSGAQSKLEFPTLFKAKVLRYWQSEQLITQISRNVFTYRFTYFSSYPAKCLNFRFPTAQLAGQVKGPVAASVINKSEFLRFSQIHDPLENKMC